MGGADAEVRQSQSARWLRWLGVRISKEGVVRIDLVENMLRRSGKWKSARLR